MANFKVHPPNSAIKKMMAIYRTAKKDSPNLGESLPSRFRFPARAGADCAVIGLKVFKIWGVFWESTKQEW